MKLVLESYLLFVFTKLQPWTKPVGKVLCLRVFNIFFPTYGELV